VRTITRNTRSLRYVLSLTNIRFLLTALVLRRRSNRLSSVMAVLISLLLTLRDVLRSRATLQLEVLALRHQLHVLERSRQRRPVLTRADRLLWVWFARTPSPTCGQSSVPLRPHGCLDQPQTELVGEDRWRRTGLQI
jgi:hypothetical protein